MVLSVKKYNSFTSTNEALYENLYENALNLSSTCSYTFIKCLNKDYLWRFLNRYDPEILIVSDETNKPVMIAPFAYDRRAKKHRFIYAVNGAEYCDFIYSDKTDDSVIKNALGMVFSELEGELELNWIPEGKTKRLLEGMGYLPSHTYENTIIDLTPFENHNVYISSLSKNARQNLRTSYNRLEKDNKSIKLILEKKVSNKIFSQIIDLYQQRHNIAYGIKTGWFKGFYLKHFNYSSRCLKTSAESLHAILYIDGKMASFCSGYLREGRYIIPRLSMNTNYKFYSPGILLINELAKHAFADICISKIDLALGNEKYKLQMGGKVIYSYKFAINCYNYK
ncbi:MAG: GNAT family N-acetyltransferase [Clostridia bacterium]|nr:GNAT family N-acetyltransferase [Clostridia bacterium]